MLWYPSPGKQVCSIVNQITEESLPVEENKQPATVEARLDAMGQWASRVESQLRGLNSAAQVFTSQVEHMAAAQADLEQRVTAEKVEVQNGEINIGYKASVGQQMLLYAALAEWQSGARSLPKASKASIQTRSGGTVEYRYADIASVSEEARSAGPLGLAHFHAEVRLGGQNYIRTYLVHSGGGWISADVPLLMRENAMISSLQQWASACTMARRYGLFMVLGIAAGEDDDDGASSEPSPPPAARQNVAPRRSGAMMNNANVVRGEAQ